MNRRGIIKELKKIRLKLQEKEEVVRQAYFDEKLNLWVILKEGQTFGGEIEAYMTDEEFNARNGKNEIMFTFDRRETRKRLSESNEAGENVPI